MYNIQIPVNLEHSPGGCNYQNKIDSLDGRAVGKIMRYSIMEYQITRPSRLVTLPDTKEVWFSEIIEYCNDMEANDILIVFEFGENADLVLHIYKDEEYNFEKDADYANLVVIHTAQNGEWVDDTEDTYVTDGSLYKELNRIYSYKDFGTL